MSKINLIIKREYISRIKQKSFIIITFLTPVLMALIVILPMLIMANQEKNVKKIAVIDESKQFFSDFASSEMIKFHYLEYKPLILKDFLHKNNYYAILVIPGNFRADGICVYSEQAIPIAIKQRIRYIIDSKVELQNLLAKNIDPQIIREAKEHIPIQTLVWSKSGKLQQSVSEINTFLGLTLAFLIYMFTFVSGTQVMRGTMEEKTGRVMELLLSSIKPLYIMFGKIFGIAAVAITQFGIWIISLFLLISGVNVFFSDAIPSQFMTIFTALKNVDLVMWGVSFFIYFIGGYLLYGSMFAAVGAAVDNETDTQQFMLPITLPLILPLVLSQNLITNPDGHLAVWMSIIPFTSPLAMTIRMGFSVPFWQIAVSVAALIVTFLIITYFAAKIYRIGILAYGKKITYKELWKWIRYKN